MNNALDRERDEITPEQFDELRAYLTWSLTSSGTCSQTLGSVRGGSVER